MTQRFLDAGLVIFGKTNTPEFGAGFYFGVYADVLVPGRVSIGDPVTGDEEVFYLPIGLLRRLD